MIIDDRGIGEKKHILILNNRYILSICYTQHFNKYNTMQLDPIQCTQCHSSYGLIPFQKAHEHIVHGD